MYLDNNEEVIARLLRYIETDRYEPPDGCLKFLQRALHEIGIEIEGTSGASLRDWRLFRKVDKPSFGTVVIFRHLPFPYNSSEFHVGLMLDERWCIQSSSTTNGVGRIDITRYPMNACEITFHRPKALDEKCFLK